MATKDSKDGKAQEKKQPFTRDDFFRDLKKASRRVKQPSSQRGSKKR
jgi:hypothetical protein